MKLYAHLFLRASVLKIMRCFKESNPWVMEIGLELIPFKDKEHTPQEQLVRPPCRAQRERKCSSILGPTMSSQFCHMYPYLIGSLRIPMLYVMLCEHDLQSLDIWRGHIAKRWELPSALLAAMHIT